MRVASLKFALVLFAVLLMAEPATASSTTAQAYSPALDTLLAGGSAGTYWNGSLGYTTPPSSGLGINVSCGGVDDTAALAAAAALAEASNLTIYLPPTTCVLSAPTALNLTSGNVTVQGQGPSSVIKAKDSANLTQMIATSGTNMLWLKDFVLDGNRSNNGTLSTAASYGLIVQSQHSKIENVEVRNIARIDVAYFPPAAHSVIDHVWFHDSGATASSSDNIGVGIFGVVTDLDVGNSRFENMHPLVSPLGDSTAINICGEGLRIHGNYFLNNYNVNGGQLAVSDCSDGSHNIDAVVEGNIVEQTGTFEDDLTAGIEVNGSDAIVKGNICQGVGMDCVRLEAHSDAVLVTDNLADHYGSEGSSACINLIDNVSNAAITGNTCKNGPLGLSMQPGSYAAVVSDNFFSSTLTSPMSAATAAAITMLHDNPGYGYGYLSYSPPSIAAGGHTTAIITVPGAALTNEAHAAYSRDLQGLILTAWVSAANTVTVDLYNPTSASVSLPADVMRAWVSQRYF